MNPTPLTIQILGGLLFITLVWVIPIVFAQFCIIRNNTELSDYISYKKCLKKISEHPDDKVLYTICLGFGHAYYSHFFPDFDSAFFANFGVFLIEMPGPKEVREQLIIQDLADEITNSKGSSSNLKIQKFAA
jgi:hypothetical protein